MYQEENVEEIVEKEDTFTKEVMVDEAISLHALSRVEVPNTIRLKEEVEKMDLIILLDSRSTHSFLALDATNKMGCTINEVIL